MFVQVGYRYRIYPTMEQADALLGQMAGCRWVWNEGRALRERVWRAERRSVGYAELCRYLTAARAASAWLAAGSADCQQQALRELCVAYTRTFKARESAERRVPLPGPRRLKDGRWRTVRYTRNGYRFDRNGGLRVAGVPDGVEVRFSRGLPSLPGSVTITLDAAGRWHASFRVEVAEHELEPSGRQVGVDLGVSCALALSDGSRVENPRHLRGRERALKRSRRALARTQHGSKNRVKARARVARHHAKVGDCRRDFQHQTTTRLVRRFDLLAIEDLHVAGMTATARGTIDNPGRNVAQKAGLNRAILDVGFAAIRRQLAYKTMLRGRELRIVDRWHPSSKTCSECGQVRTKLALSERTFHCEHCGTTLDRDVNAARNILAAGLAESQNACRERVRPAAPRRARQRSMKQETLPATVGNPLP